MHPHIYDYTICEYILYICVCVCVCVCICVCVCVCEFEEQSAVTLPGFTRSSNRTLTLVQLLKKEIPLWTLLSNIYRP